MAITDSRRPPRLCENARAMAAEVRKERAKTCKRVSSDILARRKRRRILPRRIQGPALRCVRGRLLPIGQDVRKLRRQPTARNRVADSVHRRRRGGRLASARALSLSLSVCLEHIARALEDRVEHAADYVPVPEPAGTHHAYLARGRLSRLELRENFAIRGLGHQLLFALALRIRVTTDLLDRLTDCRVSADSHQLRVA